MNRVIKFRAFEYGKMDYSDIWPFTEGMDLNEGFEIWQENGAVLMQYTGLKDKNGKDIYEGDVLGHYDGNIIVSYDNDFAGFNICPYIHECTLHQNDIEVIGNIYEHKHLLIIEEK